jgi:hypothetical protein
VTPLPRDEQSGERTGALVVACAILVAVAAVAGAMPVVGASTVAGGAGAPVAAFHGGTSSPSATVDDGDGTDGTAGNGSAPATPADSTAESGDDANTPPGNGTVGTDQVVGPGPIVVDPDPPVFSPFRITRCRTVTAAATWSVASITNATGDDCIVVEADDVTLVGESGATLTGGGDGTAVALRPGYDGLTVRNLTVDGWDDGVRVLGDGTPRTATTALDGLTIRNAGVGISLDDDDLDVEVTDTLVETVSDGGIGVGSSPAGSLSLTNVTIRNVTGRAVSAYALGRLRSDGLTVDGASRSRFGVPGTGLYLEQVGTSSAGPTELRNTTIRNVDRAVELSFEGGPITFDGLEVRDVTAVVVGNDTGVEFGSVTTDGVPLPPFSVAGAVVYPSPSVDPAAPPGTTVAGGVINATSRTGFVEVDYRGTVARPFLGSVRSARFDPGLGGWLRDGRPNEDFGERSFAFYPGSTPTTYGVFYVPTPIDACTVLDAPGVYRIERVETPFNGDCLEVWADDVRLVPAGPGAGVIAPDGVGGTGVDVDGDNVTVEGVTVDGFSSGVRTSYDSTADLADLRVRNASDVGLRTYGDVAIRNATVEDAGVGWDAYAADAVTARDVTVRRSSETGVDLRNVGRIDVGGLTVDGVADGDRALGAGLTVGGPGTDRPVAATDVVVRNATRAVFVDDDVGGTVELNVEDVPGIATFGSQVDRPNLSVVATFDGPDGPLTVAASGTSSVVSVNGSLPPAPSDRPRLLGYAFVTGQGIDGGDVVVEVPLPADVAPADAAAYVRSPDGRWVAAGGTVVDGRLRVVVNTFVDATGTVAAFAAEPTPSCPAVGRPPATDPDGDGGCEDVDGDGTFDLLDVIAFLFFDPAGLTTDAERAALDFDRNGRVDFLDVVNLLFRL